MPKAKKLKTKTKPKKNQQEKGIQRTKHLQVFSASFKEAGQTTGQMPLILQRLPFRNLFLSWQLSEGENRRKKEKEAGLTWSTRCLGGEGRNKEKSKSSHRDLHVDGELQEQDKSRTGNQTLLDLMLTHLDSPLFKGSWVMMVG